jgi:hypothetical protein
MPPDEHVHIISAGETIHTAYPAIFRMLPSITSTYVLADSDVYALAPNAEIDRQRLATRKAVDAAKEISASLSIPFFRETVFSPVYPSVRTILTKIHREHPGARFTFDLSGGSKPLCIALMSFAPWLGGVVYSALDEKTPRPVPLPDRTVKTLITNPNYQTILALLLRNNWTGKSPDPGTRQWISREYLFKQLWSSYQPSRMKKAKESEPAVQVQYKKGRKPAAELTHGTFSDFMQALADAGLVITEVTGDEKRQKVYQITESGDLAFRFFASSGTSSLVQMVLEKK